MLSGLSVMCALQLRVLPWSLPWCGRFPWLPAVADYEEISITALYFGTVDLQSVPPLYYGSSVKAQTVLLDTFINKYIALVPAVVWFPWLPTAADYKDIPLL